MSAAPVAILSLLGIALAALYARVGLLVARRAGASGEHAMAFFAAFWIGVAGYGFLDAAWALALAFVDVPLALAVAILHAKVALGVAAFFGLVYYLLFLYTGRRWLLAPVAIAYGAIYAVVEYYYVWREPVGQHLGAWSAGLDYAKESAAFHDAVTLLLFVPPALAAVAYAMLVAVVQQREARRRVAITASSLAVFFASLTLGWLNGRIPWWPVAEKALALGAALAVLWTLSPGRLDARGTATAERPQQV